ncbi:hypothetical protein [Shewanella sp.]|uniref:hypothetical protein n=1 Tax=Shewanella sp. TaxID=50422 RepID=UPI003A97C053
MHQRNKPSRLPHFLHCPLEELKLDVAERSVLTPLTIDAARQLRLVVLTQRNNKSPQGNPPLNAPCNGYRDLKVDGETVTFEHTSLIIDADRHLRLVIYAKSEHD